MRTDTPTESYKSYSATDVVGHVGRTTRLSPTAISTLCAGYHELSLRHDDSYQLCPALSSIAPCHRTWTPWLGGFRPVRDSFPTSPLVVQSHCCVIPPLKVWNNLDHCQNMLSRVFKSSVRLPALSRSNLTRFRTSPVSSPVRMQYSTESKTKSEEPLAQKLNIDDPESGDLRAKTQAAQSKVENMTEPPTTENSSTSQPTQEPVAQAKNKDEPPRDSVRGQTHEAMSKSENTKET
jgi:hypothetical protein